MEPTPIKNVRMSPRACHRLAQTLWLLLALSYFVGFGILCVLFKNDKLTQTAIIFHSTAGSFLLGIGTIITCFINIKLWINLFVRDAKSMYFDFNLIKPHLDPVSLCFMVFLIYVIGCLVWVGIFRLIPQDQETQALGWTLGASTMGIASMFTILSSCKIGSSIIQLYQKAGLNRNCVKRLYINEDKKELLKNKV
jgi:hypothetical protein